MKRTFTQLILVVIAVVGFSMSSFAQFSDLIISEYAEGSSNNKYIEIYNGTGDSVNLAGYELRRISNGGLWTENSISLSGWLHDGDVIVAANSSADTLITNLSNATTAYNSATYFNGDDAVGLAKDTGSGSFIVIDAVGTWGPDPGSGWDVAGVTNGTGEHTLVRKPCVTAPDTNWTTLTAGTTAANSQWIVYAQNTWTYAGTHDTVCSSTPPPPTGDPMYAIGVINTTDVDGVADSIGTYCWTKGIVLGVDMNGGSGLSFTIYDNMDGIGVYNNSAVSGYMVNEGDSILIRGTVGQYNGLTQLGGIDSITVVNTGNMIPTPTVVTSLYESVESSLVKFENAMITAVSGSNYTLVSGTDTIMMRVDSDTDVLDSLSLIMGDSLCYVTGIVGQYDNSNPYLSGYQLFPRTYMDMDTTCGGVIITPPTPTINTYSIASLRTVDVDGVPDSLGVLCAIKGIVYGTDLDGNAGISFTVIDDTRGINIFNFNDVDNYIVNEGDEIRVVGTVDFYNGLTEFFADSIQVLSTGNCIPFPSIVTAFSESTESEYIELKNVTLADPSQWPSAGSNANLDVVTMNGDTVTMRLDKDTYIADSILNGPSGMFNIIGIGGQFDGSAPHLEGYQIFPMFVSDIDSTDYAAPAGLQINEIAITNASTFDDGSGNFYQWLEAHNSGTADVNVSGYFLSTDSTNVYSARLPRCFSNFNISLLSVVSAGDYSVLFLDNNGFAGPQYLDLTLDTLNPFIGLYTPNGTLVSSLVFSSDAAVEGYTFGAKNDDYSEGAVTFTTGTPNATNAGSAILSVISVNPENALNVYPNPVSNGNVNFNKEVSFTVYSITGQVILSKENVTTMSVSNLNNGVYIIRTTESEVVRMIVK